MGEKINMKRLVHKMGWHLMGYPYGVEWGNWLVYIPGWKTTYELGARLANW